MLIFVKTKAATVTIEAESDESVDSLKEKVSVRTSKPKNSFRLVFAGKKLENGTLASYDLQNEATIHMQENAAPKPIIIHVQYNDEETQVSIPNNTISIRDLKR